MWLILMMDVDDYFGNSVDFVRILFLWIKWWVREGFCSVEVGGLVNEVGISGINIVKELIEVEMVEGVFVIEELFC